MITAFDFLITRIHTLAFSEMNPYFSANDLGIISFGAAGTHDDYERGTPMDTAGNPEDLVEKVTRDIRNTVPITNTVAESLQAVAEQISTLLFNVNQANTAYAHTSKSLQGLSVDFDKSLAVSRLDVDIKNKVENDKRILAAINTELEKNGAQIVSNPGGVTKLQSWLFEVTKILNDDKAMYENLRKINEELNTIERKLQDSRQNTGGLTDSSIVAVSNFAILVMYENELRAKGTSSNLYISWQSYYKDFVDILKHWPELGRVGANKLFIPDPSPPVTVSPTYLSGKNLVAVTSLEQQLAKVLSSFWMSNYNELDKLQAECFKKYRPHFGHMEDLPENVFVNSIIRACQRTGEDKLRLMLAEGPADNTTTQTFFTGTGSILKITTSPAGSPCGCRFQPQIERDAFPTKRKLPITYGTIRAAQSPWSDDDDEEEEDESYHKRPRKAHGDDLYANLYAGADPPSSTVAQKAISSDYLTSDSASGTIHRALVDKVKMAIWYNNHATRELPKTIKSIISMMSALTDMSALECLNSNKSDLPYILYRGLLDLISAYEYNITNNDDANPMFQMNAEKTINVLKNAAELFKNYNPPENVVLRHKDIWYTQHQGIVSVYHICYKQVLSVILSRLTAASTYLNGNTIGSIGVLNQSDDAFYLDPALGNKVVVYKGGDSDQARVAAFNKFKDEIAGANIRAKIDVYKKNKEGIAAELAQINTEIARAFNDLKTKEGQFTEPLGDKLQAIFKKIVETRQFCAAFESPLDSSLNEEITKRAKDKNMDVFEVISRMEIETFSAEKFSNLASPGCYLNRLVTHDIKEKYKPLGEPFKRLFLVLPKLRAIADENYKLKNEIEFEPDFTTIDDQITKMQKQLDELSALKLSALEKRFSTPVIGVREPIAEMFSKYGFKYMLEQPFSINLFMMGPSGSGKSYSQYGVPGPVPPEAKGIDSVLLNLNDVKETYFQDSYHLAFGFQESYAPAARGPFIYNYKLDGNGISMEMGGKPFAITRDKLQIDYYNTQIKPLRKSTDLIRGTENNDESSRSFLVTSIKDSTGNTKCLIDSPGFEVIPQKNIHYTNPFLQLFYVIVATIQPMPTISIDWSKLDPDDLRDTYRIESAVFVKAETEWVKSTTAALVAKFAKFGLQETHLAAVRNDLVPLPEQLNWAANGITTTSFENFIKSAFLACPLSSNTDKKNEVVFTAINHNIEVWVSPSNSKMKRIFVTDSNTWDTSSEKSRLSQQQTQNLVVDRQLAYVIAWTWAVYKQIVNGPGNISNSSASSSSASSSGASSSSSGASSSRMSSYSGRLLEFIDMVASVSPAPAEVKAQMKLTLEALFINQFNMWVSDSTSKKSSKTMDQFLSQTRSAAAPPSTEKQAFYDFILTVSDMRLPNKNTTIDRYRFQKKMGYEPDFDLENISPGSYNLVFTSKIISSYTELHKGLARFIPLLNAEYAANNRAFALYNKMPNNIELFNTFLNKNTKNLFFYILNANKADKYFPFLDINQSGLAQTTAP